MRSHLQDMDNFSFLQCAKSPWSPLPPFRVSFPNDDVCVVGSQKKVLLNTTSILEMT